MVSGASQVATSRGLVRISTSRRPGTCRLSLPEVAPAVGEADAGGPDEVVIVEAIGAIIVTNILYRR